MSCIRPLLSRQLRRILEGDELVIKTFSLDRKIEIEEKLRKENILAPAQVIPGPAEADENGCAVLPECWKEDPWWERPSWLAYING